MPANKYHKDLFPLSSRKRSSQTLPVLVPPITNCGPWFCGSPNKAPSTHGGGKPLAVNQGIQFPLAELHSEQVLLKEAVFNVAAQIDTMTKPEVAVRLSDKVSMCNYRANRLACNAADQAIQIHGGMGYSRHTQFEHHYRHHRRYRITEGSDEIQLRKIAGALFGFTGGKK